MPGGASIPIAIPDQTTTSRIIVQAGSTQWPEYSAGTFIPSVSGLAGWQFDETAGTAAKARFRLRDGTTAAGILIADIELTAGGSSSQPSNPVQIVSGAIFLEMVSGTISGNCYVLL